MLIKNEGKHITAHERPDGAWTLRLFRPKQCSLFFPIGEILIVTDKKGTEPMAHKVLSFIPHIRYGCITRTAHVVTELLWSRDSGDENVFRKSPMEQADESGAPIAGFYTGSAGRARWQRQV